MNNIYFYKNINFSIFKKKRSDEDPSVFLSFQNKNNSYPQIRVTFEHQKALSRRLLRRQRLNAFCSSTQKNLTIPYRYRTLKITNGS